MERPKVLTFCHLHFFSTKKSYLWQVFFGYLVVWLVLMTTRRVFDKREQRKPALASVEDKGEANLMTGQPTKQQTPNQTTKHQINQTTK